MKRLSQAAASVVAAMAAALAPLSAARAQGEQQQQAAAPPAAVVPAPASTLPLKLDPRPTSAAISAADLMTRLYIFADDSMQGREIGTPGSARGTDYLAREARRIGLVPAGENGSYFQTLPYKTRELDPASTVTVGGAPLAFGTDWVSSGAAAIDRTDLPVVFGGTLGDSASLIAPAQAAGKLVVLRVQPGRSSFRALRGAARAVPTAAAVALVGLDQGMALFRRPSSFVDDPGARARTGSVPVVALSTAAAAKLFAAPAAQLTTGTAGSAAVSLKLVPKVTPIPFPSRNVVAVLPGSDPKLRGQYVALGAHNDHVGMSNRPVDHDSIRIYNHVVRPGGAEDSQKRATAEQQAQINQELAAWRAAHPGTARPDSIYNGADDDGSGSVSLLEIAEHLASLGVKPKRSILFVWHVGEEGGMLGSSFFTGHPTVPRDSIVAQLNLDMVGRGAASDVTGLDKEGRVLRGGPSYLQLVGSRRLSNELGDLIERANAEGRRGFTFDYAMDANGHTMNIYCRSDHQEYARYGIPITFFTTGGHSDYHQVTDEPQYIDYDHMARVAVLVDEVAVRVANLDHRIALSQPKPDAAARCQQ